MKTKRLTKLGAVLSAALVLLSGILSVSAASVPQAVIDTDRKASVSLYKYDFTSAHADGVLGDNTYISTGYADENVENTLMPYAIEGVVYGTNTHRLLVRGHRIFPDETLSASNSSEEKPEHTDTAVHRSTWTNEYRNGLTEGLLFALLILLISVFLYGIIRLKAKRS